MRLLVALVCLLAAASPVAAGKKKNKVPVPSDPTPLALNGNLSNLKGKTGSIQQFDVQIEPGLRYVLISAFAKGDVDLRAGYVDLGIDPMPFVSNGPSGAESLRIESPPSGTLRVQLVGAKKFSKCSLSVIGAQGLGARDSFRVTPALGRDTLSKSISIHAEAQSEHAYALTVPAGTRSLEATLTGTKLNAGSTFLLLQRARLPTPDSNDESAVRSSLPLTVRHDLPTPGEWFISVRTADRLVGGSLTVTIGGSTPTGSSPDDQSDGPPPSSADSLSGESGSSRHFTFEVRAGVPSVQVTLEGGTGDADLYVRKGDFATRDDFEYSSTGSDSNESVLIPAPSPGTWYVMVYGFTSYSGAKLTKRDLPAPNAPGEQEINVSVEVRIEREFGASGRILPILYITNRGSMPIEYIDTVPGHIFLNNAGSSWINAVARFRQIQLSPGQRVREPVTIQNPISGQVGYPGPVGDAVIYNIGLRFRDSNQRERTVAFRGVGL